MPPMDDNGTNAVFPTLDTVCVAFYVVCQKLRTITYFASYD